MDQGLEEHEESDAAPDVPRRDLPWGPWPFRGIGNQLSVPGSFARSVLTLMTGTTLAT